MTPVLDWLREHPDLLRWAGVVSVATFVLSLVGLPLLVAALPEDYFAHAHAPAGRFAARHPALRITALALKNLMGALLLVCGIAMLVIPGQGVLTMLVALSLLNFPGKRRLELAMVRQRRIAAALAWVRRRAGKTPFRVHPPPREQRPPARHSPPSSPAA